MAPTMKQQHPELQNCISACTECEGMCLEMVSTCLRKGGRHAEPVHISLLLCCAEVCRTSTHFMRLGSEFSAEVCAICAEVCERCAEDCEQFSADPQMQECADSCRRCAEACQQMAQAMA
jgi:hypothetical protein